MVSEVCGREQTRPLRLGRKHMIQPHIRGSSYRQELSSSIIVEDSPSPLGRSKGDLQDEETIQDGTHKSNYQRDTKHETISRLTFSLEQRSDSGKAAFSKATQLSRSLIESTWT